MQNYIDSSTSPNLTYNLIPSTTQVSTSSATYSTDTALSYTPPPGTWKVTLSASANTSGVNGIGNVILAKGGTQISDTKRNVGAVTNLVGVITLSTCVVYETVHSQTVQQFDGATALTVQLNLTSGTGAALNLVERNILFERIGN